MLDDEGCGIDVFGCKCLIYAGDYAWTEAHGAKAPSNIFRVAGYTTRPSLGGTKYNNRFLIIVGFHSKSLDYAILAWLCRPLSCSLRVLTRLKAHETSARSIMATLWTVSSASSVQQHPRSVFIANQTEFYTGDIDWSCWSFKPGALPELPRTSSWFWSEQNEQQCLNTLEKVYLTSERTTACI
jgi:hypothetical protein